MSGDDICDGAGDDICFGDELLTRPTGTGGAVMVEATPVVGEVILASDKTTLGIGESMETVDLVGEVTVTFGILRESLAARPGSLGMGGVSAEDALIASRRSSTSL